MRTSLDLTMPAGKCPTSIFRPESGGRWPGVILYMDGLGIRPALTELAQRLADHGYVVLLPDLFYRSGPYEPASFDIFADPARRKAWVERYMAPATIANVMADTAVFLDCLAGLPDVNQPRVGTVGYCMGGGRALAAAGHYPGRIAAAASFHGGNLATDAPDSPHLLAPHMRARVYVAGAIEDPSFPDDMKRRLADALTAAGVDHVVETYPARHGWVPSDTPVHDPECAERHWHALFELFDTTLR